MRALGMPQFIDIEREFTENASDLIWLKDVVFQHSRHIKRVLGLDFIRCQEKITAIKVLSRLLNLLGLRLKRVNNIYQIDLETFNDERQNIFSVWQQRDEVILTQINNMRREKYNLLSNQNPQAKNTNSVISTMVSLF